MVECRIMSKNEWRITSVAIEVEMERIARLLQKSVQFQSRTTTPHALRQSQEVKDSRDLVIRINGAK
jgi:hypothetical protein